MSDSGQNDSGSRTGGLAALGGLAGVGGLVWESLAPDAWTLWAGALGQTGNGRLYQGMGLGPGSILVCASIAALISMQEFAGWNVPFGFSAIDTPMSPEQGDFFGDGSSSFADVQALLAQAGPAGWQGVAAVSVDMTTKTLMACAQKVVDADVELERLVKQHAAAVSRTQFNLGMFQDALVLVLARVFMWECAGRVWEGWVFALATCPPLLGAGGGQLWDCYRHSHRIAGAANEIHYVTPATSARPVMATNAQAPAESGAGADAVELTGGGQSAEAGSEPAVVPRAQLVAGEWVGTAATGSSPTLARNSAPASTRLSPQGRRAAAAPAVAPVDGEDTAAGADLSPIDAAVAAAISTAPICRTT